MYVVIVSRHGSHIDTSSGSLFFHHFGEFHCKIGTQKAGDDTRN